jgi:two-component system, OmpR family, response regulator
MHGKIHILIVDDDNEIRKLLGRYLGEQGFNVTLAASRREFTEKFDADIFDLVVLDVMLPDGSGLDICRTLRQQKSMIPVILLTALKEEVDRIIGLEIGADDYLGKPFSPRELIARIRAVLRRSGEQEKPVAPSNQLAEFCGFTVDIDARQVTDRNNAEINLTGAEFELLKVMIERPGRVLSREQLLDLTQGKDISPFDRSIDVLMSRLRRKLGGEGNATIFKTIRNGGYQFVAKLERPEVRA